MINKADMVQKFIDDFAQKHFGMAQGEVQKKAICIFCGKKIRRFKDWIKTCLIMAIGGRKMAVEARNYLFNPIILRKWKGLLERRMRRRKK